MTRKMAWIGTSYLFGLLAASFLDRSVCGAVVAVMLLIGVTTLIFYKSKYARLSVCLVSAAAGLLLYIAYDCFVYENVVSLNGRDVTVSGKITAVSDYSGDKSAYTVKGRVGGVRATVTCYTDSLDVRIGDKIVFAGKAAVPEDTYTFPAKTYYKAKGIFLRINGAKDFTCERTGFSVMRTVNNYREYLLDIIYDNMDSHSAGVMAAMLFGDKSGIDSDEKTLMYRAGIGHVMAVSGVHLSVVCSLFWTVLSRLPINKYLRFLLLLLPAAVFVLMAGASNSVLRAAVMMVLVYGAELFRRRTDTFSSLGTAVILLTIASPYAVRDASFLLSVSGVFGIGVLAPMAVEGLEKRRKLGKLAKSFIASFCAMIAVFPAAMLFFDEISVISPISNVLLLPICEIALLGGIIVALTGGISFIAVPVLTVCEICCKVVIAVSSALGRLKFAYIPLGSDILRYAAVLAALASVLAFVIYKRKSGAVMFSVAAFMLVVTFADICGSCPSGSITVAVINEKNAVTAVVYDENSVCLIDMCGGKSSAGVLKYLNETGLYRLDAVVLNTDANLSLPVYESKFGLFETEKLMVPQEEKYLVSGYGGDIYFYTKSGTVSMDGFDLLFSENGDVVLSCRGSEITFFSDDSGSEYAVLVRYSGEYFTLGEAGDNLKIIIDSDGQLYCEAF